MRSQLVTPPIVRLGWAHARARHPAARKHGLDLERERGVSEYHEANQNMFHSRGRMGVRVEMDEGT
jgi:hypothetical protein